MCAHSMKKICCKNTETIYYELLIQNCLISPKWPQNGYILQHLGCFKNHYKFQEIQKCQACMQYVFCLFNFVLQYKFVIIDKIDFIIIQKSNVYGCFRCFVYFKTYVQRQAVRAQCAYMLRTSN